MSNALGDILGSNKPQEPPEFPVIRQFVQQNCSTTPQLQVSDNSIIITMPSSAAASSLQLQIHQLAKQLNSTKKLVIRIG